MFNVIVIIGYYRVYIVVNMVKGFLIFLNIVNLNISEKWDILDLICLWIYWYK